MSEIAATAARHGRELLENGFTVDQVVHEYGDLCQAITVQNAFEFTAKGTGVSLNAYAAADRVRIDIEDNCGGLPPGGTERMFCRSGNAVRIDQASGSDWRSAGAASRRIMEFSVFATDRVRAASSRSTCPATP